MGCIHSTPKTEDVIELTSDPDVDDDASKTSAPTDYSPNNPSPEKQLSENKKNHKPPISSINKSKDHVDIVWVDVTIDPSTNSYQDSLTKLQRITPSVCTCTDIQQCLHHLDTVQDKKVFLIVSDVLGEQLLPLVYHKPQIHAIYIFSQTKQHRLPWAAKWSKKVKEILFNIEDIYQKITTDSALITAGSTSISVIRRMDLPTSATNELDPAFMYSQLLKDILIEMKYEPDAKNKLVEYCQSKYADSTYQLTLIDEFAIEYKSDLAVYWYTKESFLYGSLNRALRTQDVETIMKMGFYVQDLHRQIVERYKQQSEARDDSKFKVYRGQAVSSEELEKIKTSQGGLLSFNNFLSTTLKIEVAQRFAQNAHDNENVVAVLFEMEINPKISSVPFASVDKESAIEGESEDLFSMHTVFRIISTEEVVDRLWQVKLALTSENDVQLKVLGDYMRKELGEGDSMSKLGHLMLKMGEYDQAHDIYATQFGSREKNNAQTQSHINHQLGYVFSAKGDYKTALIYYEKALQGKVDAVGAEDSSLAPTYNNIAGVYQSLGDYPSALSSYHKTLSIEEKSLSTDDLALATTYGNIGLVHRLLADYKQALSFYERALAIREKTLPLNHPDLATTYGNISGLHQDMGDYSKALEYAQKALDTRKRSLPSKHPDLATSYGNLGSVYSSMGDKTKGLQYYEKSLKIREASLPENHPDRAHSYSCIGSIYDTMEDYSMALSYFDKALAIQKQAFPENHPSFASIYDHYGSVYSSMDDKSTALSYYEKALAIRQRSFASNHPDIAISYNNLGTIYSAMEDHRKALSSYKKSLKIEQSSLPPNHPSIVTSYNNIGSVYQSMKDYSTAQFNYQRACEICQNNPQLRQSAKAAATYNRIGSVHHATKEYTTALTFFEKALKIQRKSPNSESREMAMIYNNLGLTYSAMSEHEKALSYYEKSLELEQKTLPADHRDIGTSYSNIGIVYHSLQDYSKALAYHEKARVIRENKLSPDSLILASTFSNIAAVYFDT
ncbi:unnamed protein product, partial [Adineta ricciae]